MSNEIQASNLGHSPTPPRHHLFAQAYGKQPNASFFTDGPGQQVPGPDQDAITQIGSTTISWDFWLPKSGNPSGGSWDPTAITAWFESTAAIKLWDASELKQQLSLYKKVGLAPQWMYLVDCIPGEGENATGSGPAANLGDCLPTNPYNFGVAHGHVLKLARTVSNITYAHLINEPNAHWWRTAQKVCFLIYLFLSACV
jgi:hypothetical protein